MRKIILIIHNIRSCHNVGSMLRTADGLGASVIISGYSPYPQMINDTRMPHEASRISKQISKTSLGAEEFLDWRIDADISLLLTTLKSRDYEIVGLEQTSSSVKIQHYKPSNKIALIVGSELDGLSEHLQGLTDKLLEIPMLGKKESFNVSVAAAIALFHCRFSKPS